MGVIKTSIMGSADGEEHTQWALDVQRIRGGCCFGPSET